MKLSFLLAQRQVLQKQSHLANLAFIYARLAEFAGQIRRARLVGEVRLRQAMPDRERYWASLDALHGCQSVLDEHFRDEDVMDLADCIAYVTGGADLDLVFRIEDLAHHFLRPLRSQLQHAGVAIDDGETAIKGPGSLSDLQL